MARPVRRSQLRQRSLSHTPTPPTPLTNRKPACEQDCEAFSATTRLLAWMHDKRVLNTLAIIAFKQNFQADHVV